MDKEKSIESLPLNLIYYDGKMPMSEKLLLYTLKCHGAKKYGQFRDWLQAEKLKNKLDKVTFKLSKASLIITLIIKNIRKVAMKIL